MTMESQCQLEVQSHSKSDCRLQDSTRSWQINPADRAFNPSDLKGMFVGNTTIHGSIHINLNQSQQLSKNTAEYHECVRSPRGSPQFARKFKRIRVIEDDDSD